MAVTRGQSFNSKIASTSATFGAAANAVGTASRLSAAISTGYQTGGVVSAIRAVNLPAAGEAIGDITSAIARHKLL